MSLSTKPQAYTYAIYLLEKIQSETGADNTIQECIESIKIAFENHEQKVEVVGDYLKSLVDKKVLKPFYNEMLEVLITDIQQCDIYLKLDSERFKNPLHRRYESEMAVEFLLNPTSKMLEMTKQVSEQIIKTLEDTIKNGNFREKLMLNELYTHLKQYDDVSLGAFKNSFSFKDVIEVLKNNRAEDFIKIMHIHYKFSRHLFKHIPLNHAPQTKPSGKFAELLVNFWKYMKKEEFKTVYDFTDPVVFFREAIRLKGDKPTDDGFKYRAYLSDYILYGSPLYTAERNKGRSGEVEDITVTQMGLMQDDDDAQGLPTYNNNFWVPDCRAQAANLDSQYVKDLIHNDALWVSGPSGMTSLFLGMMEELVNFENENLKRLYFAAFVFYIVGGGWHSLPELIAPAEYALGLFPGYKVQVPDVGGGNLGSAPNVYVFLEKMMQLDPEFAQRRKIAWEKYLDYFAKNYALGPLPNLEEITAIRFALIKANEKYNEYILNENNKKEGKLENSNTLQFYVPQLVDKEKISELISFCLKKDYFEIMKSIKKFIDDTKLTSSLEKNSNYHPFIESFLQELKKDQKVYNKLRQSLNLKDLNSAFQAVSLSNKDSKTDPFDVPNYSW